MRFRHIHGFKAVGDMGATENPGRAPQNLVLERLRKRLDSLFASGKIPGENGLNEIFPVGLTAERGRVLKEVCAAVNAQRTLEIGMGWGVSTLCILEALLTNGAEPIAHVAVDPFQKAIFHNAARMMLGELELEERVEFYGEMSLLGLTRLLRQGRRFDFAFIDGDHRFDACFTDFCLVHHLLLPGGVVLFDDTWLDAVHLTARYAITNLGYTELVPPCAVPFHCSRPMLRGLIKPAAEPPRNGLWTEPLVAFFDPQPSSPTQPGAAHEDNGSQRPVAANLVAAGLYEAAMIDTLDLVAGKCRAARALLSGAYSARASVVLEETEPLLDDLRRAIAEPQFAAAARKLLASIADAIDVIKAERKAAPITGMLAATEQLKQLIRRQLHGHEPT